MDRRNFIKNLGYIVVGSTLPREIYAQNSDKIKKELAEQEKLDLAYKTMDLIIQIPDQENAFTETQNKILKGDVAETYVYVFANQITDQNGKVTPKERKIALNYLVSPQVSQKIADKYVGNNDGKCDFEEMNGLNKLINKNPGLERVMKMYYSSKDYNK